MLRAYETLNDEDKRRGYDLIYPSLKGRSASSPRSREPTSVPGSTGSETAQIAALRKSKLARAQQWRTSKSTIDTSISRIGRAVRQLEQEIDGFVSILAAEAAEEAQKNSWSTWILSPILKKVEDSDDVKAQKDRARQERRIEKDMKERRLEAKRAELKMTKMTMERLKTDIDAADLRDNVKMQELQNTIWRKENLQRQEKERVEREYRAQEMRRQQEQWEKKEREAAEARERQRAAARRAEQQRAEEEAQQWRKAFEETLKRQEELSKQQERSTSTRYFGEEDAHWNDSETCAHEGWWPKVQGRTACPECYDTWTYLLQCPGCAMKACPKCQAAVRPKRQRNAARTHRRARSRMREPSPTFYYDDYD